LGEGAKVYTALGREAYNTDEVWVHGDRGPAAGVSFMNDEAQSSGPTPAAEEPQRTFAEFLESVPPSEFARVSDLFQTKYAPGSGTWHELAVPEIKLHCPSDICNGPRIFRFKSGERNLSRSTEAKLTYFTYICSNCRRNEKLFSLHASRRDEKNDESTAGVCYKIGEFPAYGPPTPNRLLKLFGKDRVIFLKGRQCENHGLGIGAFVYYRRVVENHKDKIIDEIIKVATKIAPEMVDALELAKKEQQFSKALASVKDAIPQALLINGHNPLTLLHSALSEGLHAQSDEDCLNLAHDIRVVLAELAERIGQVLKDEAELNAAISRLMKPKDNS
jgi:hypothetical protein